MRYQEGHAVRAALLHRLSPYLHRSSVDNTVKCISIVGKQRATKQFCCTVDIRTGQSWFDLTRVRVRSYHVTILGGPPAAADTVPQVGLERGPYVAETYEVTLEQRRVVVDVPV